MSKNVHMVLQGKGGVGKSFVASLLAQYFRSRNVNPLCIDTDPVNATFASYKAFDVQRLEIMKDNDVDQRAFDGLVEKIMGCDDDTTVIIDNGAATFVPLCSYLVENGVIDILDAGNVTTLIHSILTGGQAFGDTTTGLGNLFECFPNTPVCVWSNEFWGKPQLNGQPVETSRLFTDHEDQIHSKITIPERRKDTFGHDMEVMLKAKKTFAEAINDGSQNIMARQRLGMIWKNLSGQMAEAEL